MRKEETQIKPYSWLNKESKEILYNGYIRNDITVQERVEEISKYIAEEVLGKKELTQKFINVIANGWCSLSSPIWSNIATEKGFGISCFNTHVPNTLPGINESLSEVSMQTKMGGGTSGYFGELYPAGTSLSSGAKSSGAISFIKWFELITQTVMQNGTRRGYFAGYLDIDHPEIEEFLKIKDRTNDIQDINTGVVIPDGWMEEMINGDKDKRNLWAKVLGSRREKGVPYIFFKDNANRNKPQVYIDKNLTINSSNLCSEIMLPSKEDESFVCCLLSMNLEKYDEWKDTDAVYTMTWFLDGVMEDFIRKVKDVPQMYRNYNFAKRHRALGLGALGWHSYLQSKGVPFEGLEAQRYNNEIFKHIQEESLRASKDLAKEYGEPEVMKGTGLRNSTNVALAPTTTSSAILGQVSPGIEPYFSNYYRVTLAKGSYMRKNKHLEKLLEEKGKNTDEVWESIRIKQGSVQHLDFLSAREKEVFKTFREISPVTVIQQASARQKYIDQGQSLNLLISNELPIKELNKLHIDAWKLGLKSLYYQRGISTSKEKALELMDCVSCSA